MSVWWSGHKWWDHLYLLNTQSLLFINAFNIGSQNNEIYVFENRLLFWSRQNKNNYLKVFILEFSAIDWFSAGAVKVSEVAALAHKLRNHAVENGPLKLSFLRRGLLLIKHQLEKKKNLQDIITTSNTRAGEPANFFAATAPDFFIKRLRLLIFFPSGSSAAPGIFFRAVPAPAPKGPKHWLWPAPAPWQNSLFPANY